MKVSPVRGGIWFLIRVATMIVRVSDIRVLQPPNVVIFCPLAQRIPIPTMILASRNSVAADCANSKR